MRRVVLGHKTVLEYGLTYEQANDLQQALRERKDLEHLLKDRTIWVSSQGTGQNVTWYVYLIEENLQKAFLENPESFVFELPGPGRLSASSVDEQVTNHKDMRAYD